MVAEIYLSHNYVYDNKRIFAGNLLKLLIVMSGSADSLLKSLFLSFITNLNISGSFRAGMTLGEGI